MTQKPSDFPRIRALYALSKLSSALSSDVLSGGSIAQRFSIPVDRTVQLFGAVVSQIALFTAFRQAMNVKKVTSLVDQAGNTLNAEITVDSDGSGLVKLSGKVLRFENAGLLSKDAGRRVEALGRVLANHTLSLQEGARLQEAVAKQEFSDEDFLACVGALAASQESLASSLAPKIQARQIALGDVLPEPLPYWEQLTAPLYTSKSLPEFIGNELQAQRAFLLDGGSHKAMRSIATSFCAPELTPFEQFRMLSADTVLSMLEEATKLTDHFGLVGAFEICGDWYQRDTRFGPVGDKLLAALFGSEQRLRDMCWVFGAGFILATARLHQHQTLRRKPAFWRRLTGAAHASVLARILGPSSIEPRSLFKWAAEISGKQYYNSICLDMADEPRWLPDWLTPDVLIPDAFGRVSAVVQRFPEGVSNQEWSSRIEEAQAILGEGGQVRMTYPAIGESRPRTQPELEAMGELAALYKQFIDDPSLEKFVLRGPLFFSFGTPSGVLPAAADVIANLRRTPMKWDDDALQSAIMLAIYVAVQLRSRALADLAAEYLIENVPTLGQENRVTELFFRLVECAAADPDQANGKRVLARRLEALAFLAKGEHLPDIYDSLLKLQKLDSDLGQLLGKSVAAARMGSKAA